MKSWNLAVRLAALLLLLTARARPGAAADIKGPCAADAQRFCPGVRHDRRHVLQCLQAHSAELSAPCKVSVQAAAGDRAARRQACQPDIQKFCKDTGHERGHFVKCLKAHERELAPACKSVIAGSGATPLPTPEASGATGPH